MSIVHFLESANPLKKEPIPHTIMNLIIDYLLVNELKPGDKLPTEAEIAESLHVGKGSVREAIKMLCSIGAVEIRRGIGTFVSETISESVLNPLVLSLAFEERNHKNLSELRFIFDTAVILLVREKITDEDFNRLQEANEKIKMAAEKDPNDLKRIRDLDVGFHECCLEIANNPYLIKIGKALYKLFLGTMEKSIKTDPISPYYSHNKFIKALKTRDRNIIWSAIKESYSSWPHSLSKGLVEHQSAGK
jgi:GntR family transcriptional repressor for pyruvate dehydrogenase complex